MLIIDVYTGITIPGMIVFNTLGLTVTEAPSPDDRIVDLQEDLDETRQEQNETRA